MPPTLTFLMSSFMVTANGRFALVWQQCALGNVHLQRNQAMPLGFKRVDYEIRTLLALTTVASTK